jgi:hypothetical protein
MAANEYYTTSATSSNNHIAHQYIEPPSPATSARPPTSVYTNHQPSRGSYIQSSYSASGSIDGRYDNTHHSRDSYYSGISGGTLHDERQYADNIPLKSPHARPYSQEPLVDQNTQYSPPSPQSPQPAKASSSRRKKQGWFRGKITWVVFAATLVQFGVFIAEIVVNGELHAVCWNESLLIRVEQRTRRDRPS